MGDTEDKKTEKTVSRRHVMQVVEVADDDEPVKHDDMTPVEDTPAVESESPAAKEDIPGETSLPEAKQKEVVSELFKKEEQHYGYPNIATKKKSSAAALLIWVLIMIGTVSLIIVIIYMLKNNTIRTPSILLRPTPTVTLMPTEEVTPTPAVDKKKITIQILNGSGVSGVASTVKKLLEDKGYTVAETGNAKNYNYQKTEVYVKQGNESYIELLTSDLSGSYSVGSSAATLEEKASYSARIIVGKE